MNGATALTTVATIPAGHKIALRNVEDGAAMRKYGQIIGFADGDVQAGEHVHSHNLVMKPYEREHSFCADYQPTEFYSEAERRTFNGYARPGGRAGTRNYIAVISNVNCSNSVSRYVVERFRGADFDREYPGIDGVIALKTQGGCGVDPGGPM